jgi:hypothetical protein
MIVCQSAGRGSVLLVVHASRLAADSRARPRREQRRARRRRIRRRRLTLGLVLAIALAVVFAYARSGGPGPGVAARPLSAHRDAVRRSAVVRRARRAYEPSRVAPVIRLGSHGEGVWHAAALPVGGRPAILVTSFRPEEALPANVAYVAWIDHARTRLALYPGRLEPPSGSPRGPAEVPLAERGGLLAAFNSGFTYRDARGGFAVDGHVYEPLRPGLGTLVGYRDGRVALITWHGGPTPGPGVAFARQNLALLVDGGRPNATVANGSLWGSTLGGAIRVPRSGVGIDARGNLLYLAANGQTPASLASALIRAGAVRAMELDINPEWPSFITYGSSGGRYPSKLVPNVMQSASRYLVPDNRDFFAVFRRVDGANGLVPLR